MIMEITKIATPWIAEDDLLLKNSVEAGASLEALAKGAVRFSRIFTLQELRERWHSLLYDPVISATASARMVALELSASNLSSKSNKSGTSKHSPEVVGKRKNRSIRKQYFAMRKRIHCELFNSTDLGFTGDPNFNDCIGGGSFQEHFNLDNEPPIGSFMPSSHNDFEAINCDPGNYNREFDGTQPFNSLFSCDNSSINPMGFSPPLPTMPLWKTIEDISAPASPINVSLRNESHGGEETLIPHNDFVDISDSLLNLTNEDEILFMVDDAKDTMPMSPSDDLNPHKLLSQNVLENDVPSVTEPKSPMVPNITHDDKHGVPYSEDNISSSVLLPDHHSLEQHDGIINCTLNTEDPEIPSNDDIFSTEDIEISVPCEEQRFPDSVSARVSSYNKNDNAQALSSVKKSEKPAQLFNTSPIVGHDSLQEIHSNHSQFPSTSRLAIVSSQTNNACGNPSRSKQVYATPNASLEGGVKDEIIKNGLEKADAPASIGKCMSFHAEPGSLEVASLEVENHSSSDEDEIESDDDVPSFSDIEALILEMDLDPSDHESYIHRQVSRYQSEEAKRSIIRMEQCARSSMNRAIASRNAFAILYGYHSKHYIKKVEVTLGRSTEDCDVDIDLSREGRANKISRKQAVIKMEEDGSFSLKNLGKSSIVVNGKEVANGQFLSLSPSSLIEIRGMRFLFETNHKSVLRYLSNIAKSQETTSGFDWLPE